MRCTDRHPNPACLPSLLVRRERRGALKKPGTTRMSQTCRIACFRSRDQRPRVQTGSQVPRCSQTRSQLLGNSDVTRSLFPRPQRRGPMKHPLSHQRPTLGRSFPRLHRRGPIEAGMAVVRAEFGSFFPRLHRRGPIEARSLRGLDRSGIGAPCDGTADGSRRVDRYTLGKQWGGNGSPKIREAKLTST